MIDIEHLCPGCMHQRKYLSQPCPNCGYPNRQIHATGAIPPLTILSGRYLLGCPVGKGGFGITYIAMDLPKEEIVAVKEFFPAELAIRDEENNAVLPASEDKALYFRAGLKSFCEEGRLLQLCADIPAIVSFREMLRENETAYLVMDYVQGISLRKYMKQHREPFAEDQALELMHPVMEALSAMHRRGILHRDISPENLILGPDQQLTLIDFGAAREFSTDEEENLTIILKRGYAPEEQYHSGSRQGPWTDLYAACAVLYHMMTNILPQEAAARVESDQLTPLRRLPGFTFRESTCAALEKGLQVDPAERYSDIPALIKELYPAKRTDLSQISEEAHEAEFREEAHEAESYEAESHKEHSVNAEKSNELLKAIAEDELTKKLEEAESSKGTEKKSNESELAASAEISMLSNQTNAEQANQLSEKFFHDTEESSEKTSDSVPELGREANIIVRISMVISLVFSLFIIIVLIISYGFGSNSSGSVSSSNTNMSSNTSKSSSNTSKSSSMETTNAERAETDNTETAKAETSASKPAIDISSEINTLNSTLSEDNFHNFPAAVQDVFDLWCQALEENDKETINKISEHASEWCQLLKEHFSELYILNRVSFTDPDTLTDDEIDLFDSLRKACGKLLNLVNASMLATGKPVLEELSPTVTDIFTQAFYDVTSDTGRSFSCRYNTCLDEFALLRYLYEDIFSCDYKLPDSYPDAHASNHPEAFQQGLRDFMKNAQKDDGTLAVFDVNSDFWLNTYEHVFSRNVNSIVSCDFGCFDFFRQGRAVLNELAEDRKSEFSDLAALAANSLNKDDPDSYNFIDQIIDNYGSQEKLPKGYYVYNDADGFFGYDDSSLSTTALIVSNDGIYYGELQNGKRSGYGIQFYFRPGYSYSVPPAVYRGSWSKGLTDGDGTYYEYQFHNQLHSSRPYCISGHWKDGFENGTMTIAEGWRDSERSKQCQYESENGIRTFTGRQTKEGFLIFAENGDWYWFTTDSNEDNLYKTPSFLSPRSRPHVGVNESVKNGQ